MCVCFGATPDADIALAAAPREAPAAGRKAAAPKGGGAEAQIEGGATDPVALALAPAKGKQKYYFS